MLGLLEDRAQPGDVGGGDIERFPQARRESALGGHREAAGLAHPVAREKPHQRCVLLVQTPVDGVGLGQRRLEQHPDDLPLLVAEEEAQRIDAPAEATVHQAQRLRQVRRGKGPGDLLDETRRTPLRS